MFCQLLILVMRQNEQYLQFKVEKDNQNEIQCGYKANKHTLLYF